MAQILVRDLDVAVVERMKARARRKGRSLEAEIRKLIEDAAQRDAAEVEFWEIADRLREELRGREHTDSAILIREDRDNWRSE